MTPRSRMVLLAALAWLPAASAQAQDWKPVYTQSQVYFVAKDNLAALAELKSGKKDGTVPLSVENAKKEKVESEAVLSCVKGRCDVVGDHKAGGTYRMPAKLDARTSPISRTNASHAAKRPEGVSESVWNVIVNSSILPGNWAKSAIALEKLKKEKPQAYAKIAGGGNPTYESIFKALQTGVIRNQPAAQIAAAAAAVAEREGRSPAPAAQAAPAGAQQAAAPPPQAQGAPVEDPSKTPGSLANAQHATAKLVELLEQDAVKKDFAERIKRFINAPTGDAAYTRLEPAKKAAALQQLSGGVDAWVRENTGAPDKRAKAAVMYYVMGDEAKPWFAAHPGLADMARPMRLRQDFDSALTPFTEGAAKQGQTAGVAAARPYTGEADWITAFLTFAVGKAEEVMKKAHITAQAAQLSIQNNQGPATSVAGARTRTAGSFQGRTFSMDDMYGQFRSNKGPIVQYLPIPGTNKFRKISIGIYTDDAGGYGPPTKIRERLGIFDISEDGQTNPGPANVFGQYFDITPGGGDRVFRLDDRRPDTVKYKLSLNNGEIKFAALGDSGPVGETISTTVNDLYQRRHRQVREDGYNVEMNGKSYRLFAQGGQFGTLLYYPLDESGEMKPCRGSDCSPELLAMVTKVDGGKTVPVGSKVGLGYVGHKDGKPQGFNLVWKPDLNLWEAEESDSIEARPKAAEPPKKDDKPKDGDKPAGDKPKPDEPAKPDGDGATAGTGLKDCKFEKDGEYPLDRMPNALYRTSKDDGLAVFTEKNPRQPTDGNNSYVCVFGEKALTMSGIIPKGDIEIKGNKLTIRTVSIDGGTSGAKFAFPSDLKDVSLGEDGWLAKGSNKKWRQAVATGSGVAGEVYIIDASKIRARLKDQLGSAGKVADVRLKREFAKAAQTAFAPEFVVYLHKDEKHIEQAMKLVDEYGKGSVCVEQKGAVEAYMKKVLGQKEFKDKLAEVSSKATEPLHFTIECKAMAEIQHSKLPFSIVKPSWFADGKGYLCAKEGKLGEDCAAPTN